MSWKSLLLRSAALALMLEPTACGLYTSGIGPENGTGGAGGAASSSTQSGTSASSGTSGSSGSGVSSSSGATMENCFDNKDNDGNMQVDCADPGCGGVTQCLDVPMGWSPIWILEVDPMMAPGTCPDMKTMQKRYFTKPGGPATCSACQCPLNAGATCNAPQIHCYFNNDTCSGGNGYQGQPAMSGCVDIMGVPSMSNSSGSCEISGPAMAQGSCTKSGGVATLPPKWGGAVFLCDAPSSPSPGGCASGTCVPAGMAPDGSKVCVKKDGNDPCPVGWTTISAYNDGADSRGCDPCTCSVGCTGGGYILHDSNSCGNLTAPKAVNPMGCTTMTNLFDYGDGSLEVTAATPTPSCTGGAPKGQVDLPGQVQICCK